MPATTRNPVVDLAMDLLCELPNVAALDVLDHAMRSGRGRRPDFRNSGATASLYADHRDPPSPFAELLRRAFAPNMDPRDLMLLALRGKNHDMHLQSAISSANERWQEVLELFSERYDRWDVSDSSLRLVTEVDSLQRAANH